MVAPGGFEPPSARPKPAMLGRYTTGLVFCFHFSLRRESKGYTFFLDLWRYLLFPSFEKG